MDETNKYGEEIRPKKAMNDIERMEKEVHLANKKLKDMEQELLLVYRHLFRNLFIGGSGLNGPERGY